MIKQSLAAVGLGCAAWWPSMAGAFALNFDAVSAAGRPVSFNLNLVPGQDYLTVTDTVAADGTLHRVTKGINDVLNPVWELTEWGGTSLHSIDAPGFEFQLDAFLRPDGSSELRLGTSESYIPGSSYQEFSKLSFTLTCACSALYTQDITASTFARYDALKDGQAEMLFRHLEEWPDGSSTVTEDRRVVQFSAVPEPTVVGLMLAGVVACLGQRRWRASSRP